MQRNYVALPTGASDAHFILPLGRTGQNNAQCVMDHMEDANAIHQRMVESIETLLKYTDFDKIVAALDIDESSRADARRLWAFIDQQTDSIFENFYQKWLTIDITGVYKFRTEEITALKEKQRRHWEELLSGRLDFNYIATALRVGMVHRDAQITAQFYLIGYSIIKLEIMAIVALKEPDQVQRVRLLRVLEKFVAVDIGLTMLGYNSGSF
jgi:hypothetical protein